MEYQIPKGFEDFVSNAETLLGQFDSFPSSSSAIDVVVYSVFALHDLDDGRCDDRPPSIQDLKYLHQLCADINAYASSIYKEYIWYKDVFRLYVVKVRERFIYQITRSYNHYFIPCSDLFIPCFTPPTFQVHSLHLHSHHILLG